MMTSLATAFYGQCCRRHVVGKQVVSYISAVRFVIVEVFVACVLNLIIVTSYYACLLLYLERIFCFTQQTQFALQHGGVYFKYSVTIDTESNDVNTLHLWVTRRRC